MSRFMNFRDCSCPWKQLLISEVKQLIIINNATRSPHTVSWGRRGTKERKPVSHHLAVETRSCLATAPTAHEAVGEKHSCLILASRAKDQVPGAGGGARGRSEESDRNAKFLSIHLYLIALCPEAHDLIIFIIASASSVPNLTEGNKIIQPLQKMQPW